MSYKRIATEEAWAPLSLLDRFVDMADKKTLNDPGFEALWTLLGHNPTLREKLSDIGEKRIADMDGFGIDKQILSLTAPGVQVFDADTAKAIATETNDQVAEAVRAHPDRFAALTACTPQDPPAAAKEIERGVNTLGMKGVIINSHTHGEYLDDEKFWPIFEAAESLDAPVYIHPAAPPPKMAVPYVERGLEGAILGFGAEMQVHILGLIRAGVFDRFPNLKVVIGHGGEALPFWLYRIDYMNSNYVSVPLERKPSEYLQSNIYSTTSGMAWAPVITFIQDVLGMDQVMYAMDYPYQAKLEEVQTQDALPISDADKKKFFQTNAERVFGV